MQTTFEQEQIILWSLLHEPGDALARKVFDERGIEALDDFRSGRAKSIWPELVGEDFAQQVPELIERISLRLPHRNVIAVIERGIRWNSRPVFPQEAPKLFAKLSDLYPHHPYLLWVAGDVSFLQEDCVAVVGTRNPSEAGMAKTERLVEKLAMPVISGGAVGIDSRAHATALKLGLKTAAFMAGGLDRAYPQSNWELFHTIVQQGGAMISEMACGTAPTAFRFLQRNRLIAAASSATYVVEAGFRSGSKNTAGHARQLGRGSYAVAGPIGSAAAGCNALIASGIADPIWLGQHPVHPSQIKRRVDDAILNGAKTLEEIAIESGVSLRDVRGILAR
jgi:DNA processing protein